MSPRRKAMYVCLATVLVLAGVGLVLYGKGVIAQPDSGPDSGPVKVDVVAIGRQHGDDTVRHLFSTPPKDRYTSCVTSGGGVEPHPIGSDWKTPTWYKHCFAQLPGRKGVYVVMAVAPLSKGAEVRPEDGYIVAADKPPAFYVGFEQRSDGEGIMLYDPERKLGLWKPPGIDATDLGPGDIQVTAGGSGTLNDDQYDPRVYTAVQQALAAFDAYAITGN